MSGSCFPGSSAVHDRAPSSRLFCAGRSSPPRTAPPRSGLRQRRCDGADSVGPPAACASAQPDAGHLGLAWPPLSSGRLQSYRIGVYFPCAPTPGQLPTRGFHLVWLSGSLLLASRPLSSLVAPSCMLQCHAFPGQLLQPGRPRRVEVLLAGAPCANSSRCCSA